MTLRRCRVTWDNDGDGHFDQSVRYDPNGQFYDADEVDTENAAIHRTLRNLLREYCAVTKLKPWSHPDWQCEEVVRQAVTALGLKYGEKL